MRCAHCGRRLTSPAFTAPAGWMLGPVCLSRPGDLSPEIRAVLVDLELIKRMRGKWRVVVAPKRKRVVNAIPARKAKVLPGQIDLWEYNPAF